MPLTKRQIKKILETFTEEEYLQLAWDWPAWARKNQLPPDGDWTIWLIMAGRGYGKTRSGAEFIRARVESGESRNIALIGATAADARDVMVEGPSGILNISPPWNRPLYEPSKRRITWPNGAVASLFTAEEPERLRGPQCDTFWCDEAGAWPNKEAWDQLMFGFRLGDNPRGIVTTTPRPTQLIREIIKRSDTVVTRGSTYENRANLAKSFFQQVIKQYEGTRLGRQELKGELLEDTPGAIWTTEMIEKSRMKHLPCELSRIVVGVDPAVTSHEESDETGIVVVGRGSGDWKDHYFVLGDYSGRHPSVKTDPRVKTWPEMAIKAYQLHGADKIIAERNNGGDLVAGAIRQIAPSVAVEPVVATRGKIRRAEPVAMLWEQGRAHFVGVQHHLEDQMTTFQPDDPTSRSPDRMDALVWAATALMDTEQIIVL
jgi:phage terminase large subunit-like protein